MFTKEDVQDMNQVSKDLKKTGQKQSDYCFICCCVPTGAPEDGRGREGSGVKMDKRFEHPWFSILADIKKEAKEKGLTEDDARIIIHKTILTVKKELNVSGNMTDLPKKHIAAAKRISERVMEDYLG